MVLQLIFQASKLPFIAMPRRSRHDQSAAILRICQCKHASGKHFVRAFNYVRAAQRLVDDILHHTKGILQPMRDFLQKMRTLFFDTRGRLFLRAGVAL